VNVSLQVPCVCIFWSYTSQYVVVALVDVGEDLDEFGEPKEAKSPASASETKSLQSVASTRETASATSSAAPTLDARAKFGAHLFLLSGVELGWVFTELELNCPHVLESWGESKIEINVDEIPSDIFGRLQKYVDSLVEDNAEESESPESGGPKKKKRKSSVS
jgi:hypothetical protein